MKAMKAVTEMTSEAQAQAQAPAVDKAKTPRVKIVAPGFRFSPATRHKVDRLRVQVDTLGMLLVRLFLPLVPSGPLPLVLSIYNIMATVTVLTVDSTRLPEHSSTRAKQRQSWISAAKMVPFLVMAWIALAFMGHRPIHFPTLAVPALISMLVGAYMDELLFRNILQPRLRQKGATRWVAITAQSLLFAASFGIRHGSVAVVVGSFILGIANGWLVYKSRSLWAAFALSIAWHSFFS